MRSLKVFATDARIPINGSIHRVRVIAAVERRRRCWELSPLHMNRYCRDWEKTFKSSEVEAAMANPGVLLAKYLDEEGARFVEFQKLERKEPIRIASISELKSQDSPPSAPEKKASAQE